MGRKTIEVEMLRSTVNGTLSTMEGHEKRDVAYRLGMITLLEHVLHTTGNYRGFKYLEQKAVPVGATPGINTDDHNNPLSDYGLRFSCTDDSRRFYF